MKFLSILLLSAASVSAFAGPEEHLANQICYQLVGENSAIIQDQIPNEVCVEDVTVDYNTQTVQVVSYVYGNLFRDLKLVNTTKKNEDNMLFTASSEYFKVSNPSCGESESDTITIKGTTDNLGNANPANLEINITQKYTYDICHSYPVSKTLKYKISN